MLNSVFEDFKYAMRSGNMITKIMIVNVAIFIMLNLVKVFDFNSGVDPQSIFHTIENLLSVPSSIGTLIRQPWSILTHMFLHVGFWHIFWNMLLLYWFGRIVGDFIGDNRILPIYIMGGLMGAVFYIVTDQFLPNGTAGNAYALGASAAVMAMVWTAATLSPDYIMRLILIGPVKLKYIALVLFILDIFQSAGSSNSGGAFAHIGGALFGMLYVYLLRKGTDLTEPWQADFWQNKPARKKTSRSSFKVVHKSESKPPPKKERPRSTQEELDRILDKINQQGYDKLSQEEREFLYQASKK
ncbi:MAG: rhomboid family intramembrane serine protease [Saprospiraceae bacterium]|nr:rhomboid family intramembrane serine protease [Saprospiraceae bacterium]